MKRQTVIGVTFIIAVFTAATIFAVVSTAQHPIALTEKSKASTQHNDLPTPTAEPTPTPTPEPPYIPPPSPYMLTQ